MERKTDIIFDGNFIYHRAFSIWCCYYRDQNIKEVLQTKEGRQRLIRKAIIDACAVLKKFEPHVNLGRVIFVFDKRSWRYDIYPDYKYARTKVKSDHYEEFIDVLWRFARMLEHRGFITTYVDGAEGDDMLATWVYFNSHFPENKTLIITADSDIRQLVSPSVSVYCPKKDTEVVYEDERVDADFLASYPEGVKVERISPAELVLSKATMGDTSDNIPKIKRGFGPKAFEKMFGEAISRNLVFPLGGYPDAVADYIVTNYPLKEHEETIRRNCQLTYLSPLSMPEDVCNRAIDEVIAKAYSYTFDGSFTLDSVYYGDDN